MNKRQSIPFIALLIAFLVWSFFKKDPIIPELPEHHPSYIASNVKSKHFDEQGILDYQIFSEQATSFSEDDITTFKSPKAILYIQNKDTNTTTTWQISSKDGILHQQDKLVLTTDVLVENLSLDQLVQTMETEELTLFIDEKEIVSDIFVSWKGPQGEQQGVGMWSSLISEELKMKDKIKAVYLNENK
ncbi:MAG: LPS export ABC transporter periplasmic protein LptC [Psychromonas sp.]